MGSFKRCDGETAMRSRTQLHDLDAAKQAYQFGRASYLKDATQGTMTRNPYLAGSIFHRAFEEGQRLEARSSNKNMEEASFLEPIK